MARQSAAAIILSIIICKFIQKKKFFLKNFEIFTSFAIVVFIYFLGFLYSSAIPIPVARSEQYLITIFGLFVENKNFKELIIFFIWPFLSFGPLLIYYLILIMKNTTNFRDNLNLNFFLIFFILLIIAQPILQGIYVSGKNIIRLSTLAYPALMFYFLTNSKPKIMSKSMFLFLVILLFIWSSHPTFSQFKFLEEFKF